MCQDAHWEPAELEALPMLDLQDQIIANKLRFQLTSEHSGLISGEFVKEHGPVVAERLVIGPTGRDQGCTEQYRLLVSTAEVPQRSEERKGYFHPCSGVGLTGWCNFMRYEEAEPPFRSPIAVAVIDDISTVGPSLRVTVEEELKNQGIIDPENFELQGFGVGGDLGGPGEPALGFDLGFVTNRRSKNPMSISLDWGAATLLPPDRE